MVPWLPSAQDDPLDRAPFPPTSQALGAGSGAPGLLCAGGSLRPARLAAAYSHGIFPWFSDGEPVLWWSTAPRMVLQVQQFKLHRSLKKTLRHFVAAPGCEVRVDHAFDAVIDACAQAPREGQAGTWIVAEMIEAYRAWHRAGAVHSFETWVDGELVGGLYGVGLGRMFYGESMFSRRTDASKIALAALVAFCRTHGIAWVDCQQQTRHLASMGAAPVPREAFENHLAQAVHAPPVAHWSYHEAMWQQLGLASDATDATPPHRPPQP